MRKEREKKDGRNEEGRKKSKGTEERKSIKWK